MGKRVRSVSYHINTFSSLKNGAANMIFGQYLNEEAIAKIH
jgi:hypothetical protein